jgi:uncharacterized phage-associated protein
MVDSIEFAKYIISRVLDRNRKAEMPLDLGATKLQKLMYICDGCLLALGENFIGENVRAWQYGPVYPKVNTWLSKHPGIEDAGEPCDPNTVAQIKRIHAEYLIDQIIESWGSKTATALSEWSHQSGGPWAKALKCGSDKMNSLINKEDMRDYFSQVFFEVPAENIPPLSDEKKQGLAIILEEAEAKGEINLASFC